MGSILAICLSENKGTAKTARAEAMLVAGHGLAGDAHAGVWRRQVSILPMEQIAAFRRQGASVAFGDFGENLVVEGIAFEALRIGERLRCGGAILEVTQFGKECHTRCHIFETMGDCIMPKYGVFARVVTGGTIRVGDPVAVEER